MVPSTAVAAAAILAVAYVGRRLGTYTVSIQFKTRRWDREVKEQCLWVKDGLLMAIDELQSKGDLKRQFDEWMQDPNVVTIQGVSGLADLLGKGTDYGLVTALPVGPSLRARPRGPLHLSGRRQQRRLLEPDL